MCIQTIGCAVAATCQSGWIPSCCVHSTSFSKWRTSEDQVPTQVSTLLRSSCGMPLPFYHQLGGFPFHYQITTVGIAITCNINMGQRHCPVVFLHLFTCSLQRGALIISGLFKRLYNVLVSLALQWVVTTIIQHDLLSDTKTEMPDATAVDDNYNFLVCVLFLRPWSHTVQVGLKFNTYY